MVQYDDFGRRILISIDAQGYGRSDDRRQAAIQSALLDLLDGAAARAMLARDTWARQPAGDGELCVLPEQESEPRVVDDLVRELSSLLNRHNEGLPASAKLRLRMAIHHGVAMPAANGFSGQGVVVVSRLIDSRALRAVQRASDGDLVVILSRRVFLDIVVQRHTSLRATDFRKVRVRNKEYVEDAWVRVPGVDVHALDLPDSEDMSEPGTEPTGSADPGTAAADPVGRSAENSGQTVNATIVGTVNMPDGVIGFRNH